MSVRRSEKLWHRAFRHNHPDFGARVAYAGARRRLRRLHQARAQQAQRTEIVEGRGALAGRARRARPVVFPGAKPARASGAGTAGLERRHHSGPAHAGAYGEGADQGSRRDQFRSRAGGDHGGRCRRAAGMGS